MSPTTKNDNTAFAIAVPVAGGALCAHFGHCEQFAIFDVDTSKQEILKTRYLDPPAHEPGTLPRWLHDQGVNLVIAGGMGWRAQDIFKSQDIDVIVGAPAGSAADLVQTYLAGELQPGNNLCDH